MKVLSGTIWFLKLLSVCETTGHGKLRVSVCFAAKLDGTKLKTFIVFGATKRESKIQKHLLAWDSFEAHISDEVKRELTMCKTESLIVPGG